MAGYQSKILRSAARRRGLGSFGDLGPGALALGEWQALGLELPDLAAMRAYRLARVRAAAGRARLRRHRGHRPDQRALRHRQRQHAGLVPAQRVALRLRRDRRAGDRVRLPRQRAPVGAPRSGRRGAAGARLVFLQERRSHRRARCGLGRGARRPGARARRRQPAPRARPCQPRGRRSAPGARHQRARGPGGDGARAGDQIARRDQGHALRARRLRGGDGRDAAAPPPRRHRAGAVGASPRRGRSGAAANGSRRGCSAPARAPIPGSRNAAAV